MRRLKILFGLEAAGGGALKHLVYLVTRLNPENYDITVIISNSRGENNNLEILKLQKSGAIVILMPIKRNIHLVEDFIALIKIYFFVKKGKFDIVHAHSSKAGGLFRIAAWMNHIPKIYYTPHCFYFQGKRGIYKWIIIKFEKILAKISTGIIVSEGEKEVIKKNKIISDNKIININNAIDFDEYKQIKENEIIRTKYKLTNDCIIVGAIGRLAPQKDWKTYVYAANAVLKKFNNLKFLIVGQGELYTEIKTLIIKLGLEDKIILTGHIQDIHKIFGIIDIYVSTALWEGLPYVLLEAMNYKKPIVATDTSNSASVINEKMGFVSPVKDYHSIAEQIMFLINNRQLAEKMGETGNQILYEKFSFKLFIEQHDKLYKSSVFNIDDYSAIDLL
jgi:glycosyltransferase involved in cell wall biosynthesis